MCVMTVLSQALKDDMLSINSSNQLDMVVSNVAIKVVDQVHSERELPLSFSNLNPAC
jgi:hypothetical protein